MLNKIYRQISGYISRRGINEILKFSYSSSFMKFGMFILATGLVFGLYAASIGPAQGSRGETENRVTNIPANIIGLLVKISDLIFFLILLAWVIIPYYNWGTTSVQGSLIELIWVVTTFFSISPIGVLVLAIVQGWIPFFVQLFIILMYLCVSTYVWIMKIHGRETKVSSLKMTTTILELMLAINTVTVIYLIIVKHLNFELALISTSVILYMLVVSLSFYQLNRVHKVIYIQKYSRRFKVTYEVPGKKWWFTAKGATKHLRVYPSVEDEAEGEYKDE